MMLTTVPTKALRSQVERDSGRLARPSNLTGPSDVDSRARCEEPAMKVQIMEARYEFPTKHTHSQLGEPGYIVYGCTPSQEA